MKIDKLFLRRSYPQVHKFLDLPHLWMGERHRQLFHEPCTAMMIGYLLGGPEGGISALLHVLLDKALSTSCKRK